MNALKAHVRNGRIVADDPTDLPEGTALLIVALPEEDAALEAAIGEGLDDFDSGRTVDEAAVRARLRALG